MTKENTFSRIFYIWLTRLPGPWLLGDVVPTGAVSCLGGVEVQAGSYQPVFPVLNNAMSFLVN